MKTSEIQKGVEYAYGRYGEGRHERLYPSRCLVIEPQSQETRHRRETRILVQPLDEKTGKKKGPKVLLRPQRVFEPWAEYAEGVAFGAAYRERAKGAEERASDRAKAAIKALADLGLIEEPDWASHRVNVWGAGEEDAEDHSTISLAVGDVERMVERLQVEARL